MNRSFLLSLSFFLLAQPSSVLGGLYNVDLLGDLAPDQALYTHLLHVMGTIEVNTVTDEVIDSHLRFEHIQGDEIDGDEIYAADLPRLPQIGGAGIDFIDSGGMLFINPQPTDGSLDWSAASLYSYNFELSSGVGFGPRAILAANFFIGVEEVVFRENGNRLLVGTAVPEPSSTSLILTAVLGVAAIRRRRNVR